MKYKIGDRVQIVEDTCYDECQLGNLGTIIEVKIGDGYMVAMDGWDYTSWPEGEKSHYFWERELGDIKEITVPVLLDNESLIPTYGSKKSAGADLRANIEEAFVIYPMQRSIIPTGVRLELPVGYEAQIRPRSGLAAKHAITVLNSPGTIDEDYRGEIKVILINLSSTNYTVEPGERIAQMVIAPYVQGEFKIKEELTETERGSDGLGSTGSN